MKGHTYLYHPKNIIKLKQTTYIFNSIMSCCLSKVISNSNWQN